VNDVSAAGTFSDSNGTVTDLYGVTTSSPATSDVLLSTTVSGGGTISPATRLISVGTDTTFIVTPDSLFAVSAVTGCGGSLNSQKSIYTTGAVSEDCTIEATFVQVAESGSGTSEDPYIVTDAAQLRQISQAPSSVYRLNPSAGQDGEIDFSGAWTAIGSQEEPFTGELRGASNGNGGRVVTTVKGLGNQPLFHTIAGSAVISDIILQDQNVTASSTPAGLFAGSVLSGTQIAGNNQADISVAPSPQISNILIDASNQIAVSDPTASYTGGFAGYIDSGDFSDIRVFANVSGGSYTGGFAGYISGSANVKKSSSDGTISGSEKTGGFAGWVGSGVTISDSYSTGAVIRTAGSTNAEIGSFAGYSEATIQYSYAAAAVTYDGADNPTDKGFIGTDNGGSYTSNLLDREASGQNSTPTNAATSKTTKEMRLESTYLSLTDPWDFAGETNNGTTDIWTILDPVNGYFSYPHFNGKDYDAEIAVTEVAPIPGLKNVPIQMRLYKAGSDTNLYRPYNGDGVVPSTLPNYHAGNSFAMQNGSADDFSYEGLSVTFDVVPTAVTDLKIYAAEFVLMYDPVYMDLDTITKGSFFNSDELFFTENLSDTTIAGVTHKRVEVDMTNTGTLGFSDANVSVKDNEQALAKVAFNILKAGNTEVLVQVHHLFAFDEDASGFNPNLRISQDSEVYKGQYELWPGDFTGQSGGAPDGKVDFNDLTQFASAYFSTQDQNPYRIKYDIGSRDVYYYLTLPESDGVINFFDLVSFSTGYTVSLQRAQLTAVQESSVQVEFGAPALISEGQYAIPVQVSGDEIDVRAIHLNLYEHADAKITGVRRVGAFDRQNGFSVHQSATVHPPGPAHLSGPAHPSAPNGTTVDAALIGFEPASTVASADGPGTILELLVKSSQMPILGFNDILLANSLGQMVPAQYTQTEEMLAELPSEYTLRQNYPNPFNPSTTIGYDLPQSSEVRLDVYNVLGQRVATLVNMAQQAGRHEITMDASHLSSGVYFYHFTAGEFRQIKKMMLLK